jgi:glycosyltransferase involved in cell wall biosynthesis
MPETGNPIGRRALELGIILCSRYPSSLYSAAAKRHTLARALRSSASNYDLICIEHIELAPLLPRTRAGRWMLTQHNILSGMIAAELGRAPGARQRWFRARDLAKAQRLERWALGAYDRCVVCSQEDAARLESLLPAPAPSGRVAVVPNGVDLSALRPTPIPAAPRVLFPGTLTWSPNVDGAIWFCAEVWPRVRATVPSAELVLAGRSPVPMVIALGQLPGVSVHADVPAMAPYFEASRVVVVPLRIGTGTRLKALEAMAAGRPMVGTEIGLEGLGIEDHVHARVADDPDAMADAVIELLYNDAEARALADAGRALAVQRFGWERIGNQFVELALSMIDGEGRGQPPVRPSSKPA